MLKNSKLFYFCHLKQLVRLETFGPYHVCVCVSCTKHVCAGVEGVRV